MKYQIILAITTLCLIASCGKKDEPENTSQQQTTNSSQQMNTNTQQQTTQQTAPGNMKKDSVKSDAKTTDDKKTDDKKTDDKKTDADKKTDPKTTGDIQSTTKPVDTKQNDIDFGPIFAKKCAKCHGKDGHGKPDGAPNLTADSVRSKSDSKLIQIINNGVKNPDPDGDDMPAWKGKLSDDEIHAAVKYIRSIP